MLSIRLRNSGENLLLRAFLMISSFLEFFFVSKSTVKPIGFANSFAFLTPILDVKMMRALDASTLVPSEPVTNPSSSNCRRTSYILVWAFSISSNRTTHSGFFASPLTSIPDSLYPTYPGAEPSSFDTSISD